MKKIILLFTILCAGALSGMETKRSFWDDLPRDIRYEIINKALKTSNSLDGAIAALKNLSVVQGVEFDKLFGNLKDFTALVHGLANKFNKTKERIAQKFNTPIAKEYLTLNQSLYFTASKGSPSDLNSLVKQGADVNFVESDGETPLGYAIRMGNIEGVKFLLNAGAKPTEQDLYQAGMAPFFGQNADPVRIEIKQLIEEARKKIAK